MTVTAAHAGYVGPPREDFCYRLSRQVSIGLASEVAAGPLGGMLGEQGGVSLFATLLPILVPSEDERVGVPMLLLVSLPPALAGGPPLAVATAAAAVAAYGVPGAAGGKFAASSAESYVPSHKRTPGRGLSQSAYFPHGRWRTPRYWQVDALPAPFGSKDELVGSALLIGGLLVNIVGIPFLSACSAADSCDVGAGSEDARMRRGRAKRGSDRFRRRRRVAGRIVEVELRLCSVTFEKVALAHWGRSRRRDCMRRWGVEAKRRWHRRSSIRVAIEMLLVR
eukprot:scaffold1899_cov372-Prasinococcus_capsulatus_cf.AAC.2